MHTMQTFHMQNWQLLSFLGSVWCGPGTNEKSETMTLLKVICYSVCL